jgi:hypothetical protein
MSIFFFYKKNNIKKHLPVLVRALVPAYLYASHQFFYESPDRNHPFFHKKNSLLRQSLST